MKVITHCFNYTGAILRMAADETDGLPIKLTLIGREISILQYLDHNLLYGDAGTWDTDTLAKFAELIKSGDILMFDGCGGITKIQIDGQDEPILNMSEEYDAPPDDDPEWIPITIDLDIVPIVQTVRGNHLRIVVSHLVQNAQLPISFVTGIVPESD